jgi:class 3 adenylate cyclase
MFLPSGQGVSLSASRHRLERLIALRLEPNADKAHVDRRIWDLFGQTRAVMMTDLSGFSRNVAKFGIVHFLQTIYESIRIFVPVIEAHDGILLKADADSMMVVFRTADHAMNCAIKMQHAARKYNLDMPEEEQILLCVGLGYGRMLLIGDEDVFGAEVNAASKLGEDTAKTGEILVTESFKQNLQNPADHLEFDKLDVAPSGAAGAYAVRYWLP